LHRVWQAIAIVIGLGIIALGAATAYIFITRTASQPPRATPRPTATPSPRPSPSATGLPGASASASGLATPPTSGAPSDSAGPSPTTSATPGPLSTVTFAVEHIGLDDPSQAGAGGRQVTFTTSGAGQIRALVSGTTGGLVRLCLHKGDATDTVATPLCHAGTTGGVTATAAAGTATWTVVLTNTVSGKRPVTTVTVTYRTRTPGVQLSGFRFQGSSDQARNGFRLHTTARADGDASISATWLVNEDAEPLDHRIHIRDLTAAADVTNEAANGESAEGGGTLKRLHDYQIDLRNTSSDPGGIATLDATVSWP
jgi:hypothetical protein